METTGGSYSLRQRRRRQDRDLVFGSQRLIGLLCDRIPTIDWTNSIRKFANGKRRLHAEVLLQLPFWDSTTLTVSNTRKMLCFLGEGWERTEESSSDSSSDSDDDYCDEVSDGKVWMKSFQHEGSERYCIVCQLSRENAFLLIHLYTYLRPSNSSEVPLETLRAVIVNVYDDVLLAKSVMDGKLPEP